MQVSVETTSGLERQVTITVPAERIDQDVQKRVQQTARTARLDGFRPGKIPMKVVKSRYGKGIREEVLNQVIQETLFKATTDEKLQPANSPSIEFKNDKEGEDFQYVATFEVYPEVELADFSSVEIEKQTAEVKDEDLEKMIETLQKQQASWDDVERVAEDGDRVKIDFAGTVDGEAFDGGQAEGMDLVLGSNTMIPGFETGLIGVGAGEEKELDVTFPDTYHAENLKGKDAKFSVKVQSVAAQTLAELNTEFFSKFGMQEDTLEGFKSEVRKNMERELKNSLKMKLKDQVFRKLVEQNGIDVPTALIDNEIDNLRRQAVQQFAGPDSDFDLNMLPKEMFQEQAVSRVSVGLLVQEYVKSTELKVDDDRVQENIKELAETYQEPQQVIDWYNSNQEMLNQIQSMVLEDQVLDQLLASAKVSEVEVSYEDAIKPAQPKAETDEEAVAE